jgi:hypothetical protein
LIQSSCRSFIRVIVPYEISKVNFRVETKIIVSMGILGITDIYLKDNFEPTTPFLSDQKNLILSLNFVG